MKLKNVLIKNFKRFTELSVTDIPEEARLIILIGPNGCGKSSFFDALCTWHRMRWHGSWDPTYHRKSSVVGPTTWTNDDVQIEFHNTTPTNDREYKKVFFFRSAYRNTPEFQLQQLVHTGELLDEVRFDRMIDNDAAVMQNYQRLASKAFSDAFEHASGDITLEEFRESTIGDVRDAFCRIFPQVKLNSLGDPLTNGTFRFTKGTSKGFLFKNLSGGEKAAFDLILDLVVAKHEYDNTIFCIDEPEAHMNARLQAELLSVLFTLIPNHCQLILATHSAGMMRRARDIEVECPGSVVFLDFDGCDFDEQQQVIRPTLSSRQFWNNAYKVALDDLAALLMPELVVICEGEPKNKHTMRNYSHDARCYERIFESAFPNAQFVPGGSALQVIDDERGIGYALGVLTKGTKVIKLVDRDARSPNEIKELHERGIRVLSRRNLESYLFDDEVLRALACSVEQDDKTDVLIAEKKCILEQRCQGASDDLKSSSGEIYIVCKKILSLSDPGNNTKTFMRDTLAPLVRPNMIVYEKLKRDIFDQ